MAKRNALLLLASGALFLAGCSSEPQKTDGVAEAKSEASVAAAIKAEAPAPGPDGIANRGAEAFIKSTTLAPEQKQKIIKIYARVYNDARAIRAEISQAKSLIFKRLASTKYDSAEMEAIKAKVVALDRKRLDLMFAALAEVQEIVGFGKDKEDIYRRLRDYDLEIRSRTAMAE
jgi:Spy/CpxP family protein refolding chaperone